MTERIYYSDPSCRTFEAVVTRSFEHNGRIAVTLDRTAFYPTSGGQPFDTGRLGAVDVLETLDDDDVVHIVSSAPTSGSKVTGEIDWERRFDHMQQHTGQHVLSAAFERLFDNATVGFHMGAEVSTIDLAREASASEIERAVDAANDIVWQNRPVSIRFASREEAASLKLRKEPAREGMLRLIEIEGFDVCACGGTHVDRTGAIGVVAALTSERQRGGTRLTFVCGGRALRALRGYRDAVAGSVRLLSVLPPELPGAVERVQAESRELHKRLKDVQGKLAAYEGARLAAEAPEAGGVRVIVQAPEGWDSAGLKAVATAACASASAVAVLVSAGSPHSVVVARSAGVSLDAAAVLRQLTDRFGGRGGGKPDLAQGGGLEGRPHDIVGLAQELVTAAVRSGAR
jgi:alanyl-tRNA synthetase